jgi:predicted DCC family thiol-disulfide oxidoreductase YuxK
MIDEDYDNPIILFDGVCNLCNAFVDFIILRNTTGVYRFASLQSDLGQEKIMNCRTMEAEMDSVVLIEGEKCYFKSSAALRIARRLRFPWGLFYGFMIVPRFLRDGIYDFIANSRYQWFGKRHTCRLPTPEERSRFLD